jgi:hypothetical protein
MDTRLESTAGQSVTKSQSALEEHTNRVREINMRANNARDRLQGIADRICGQRPPSPSTQEGKAGIAAVPNGTIGELNDSIHAASALVDAIHEQINRLEQI